MKKLSLYLSIALMCVACLPTSKEENTFEYKFNGSIEGLKNTQLFLKRISMTDADDIDTAMIDENGKFTFDGSITDPAICVVVADNKHYWYAYVGEGIFDMNINYMASSIDVKDKGETKALNDMVKKQFDLMNMQKQIQYQFMGAQRSGNEAQFKALSDSASKAVQDNIKYLESFMDEHDSPLGLAAYRYLPIETERAVIDKHLEEDKKKYGDHYYMKSYVKFVEDFDKMMINKSKLVLGGEAPDITMKDPAGNDRSLYDLRGKVVLLDFWASWCGPCRRANPAVVQVYQEFKDKGFDVFSVSLDNKQEAWIQAIQKDQLTWPNHVSQLKGWQSEICRDYAIRAVPTTYLIDKEGKILGINLEPQELSVKLKEIL